MKERYDRNRIYVSEEEQAVIWNYPNLKCPYAPAKVRPFYAE
jgi:hypothetical protein